MCFMYFSKCEMLISENRRMLSARSRRREIIAGSTVSTACLIFRVISVN